MNSIPQAAQQLYLHIKAVTWQKDSHSLFDYEFNKNVVQLIFDFVVEEKYIYMYRNNANSEIIMKEHEALTSLQKLNLQLLGCLHLKPFKNRAKVDFYHASQFQKIKQKNEQVMITQGSIELLGNQQDIYLIVRSLKDNKNQNKGYKLNIGQTVKFGRIQYKISSMKKSQNEKEIQLPQAKTYFDNFATKQCHQIIQIQENQCKYCLSNEQTQQNFFISPCKCTGYVGIVHIKCLQQWIQSKVKKEVIGGTLQYNFEKFFCQLCKQQFPRFIKRSQTIYQLMPISKPKGCFVILEGVSDKANNMMVIQNIPEDGIKIGRSHECQIRIADISVSRTHATIIKKDNQFVIMDSKSKFGTLVKEDKLSLQISKIKQGIQIGRTVLTIQLTKK